MGKKQIEAVADWLFNNNYEHFGLEKARTHEAFARFEEHLPALWESSAPRLAPLYTAAGPLEALIGLGHRARAGKDTCADRLVNRHGYHRDAFARPLKVMCQALFGWGDEHLNGHLKEVVDADWGFSPRTALQRLGTECVRNLVGPQVWVKSMQLRWSGKLVITDVRFPDEAELVRSAGGQLWRIDRPGLLPSTHPSETALLDYQEWDRVLRNDSTIDALDKQVDQLIYLRGGR